jgi:hypothetical protein
MTVLAQFGPVHAHVQGLMVALAFERESGHHLALDYRRGVHRHRMTFAVAQVPSRDLFAGARVAPMCDQGHGHRHGFEALIDGKEHSHFHVHVG